MGYRSESTPRRLVDAALRDTYRENADNVRQIEFQRLDRLWRAAYESASGQRVDDDGQIVEDGPPSLEAIDTCCRLMRRRSRLLGLDAPVRGDVTTAGKSLPGSGTVIIVPDNGRDRPEEREQDGDGPDSVPGRSQRSLPKNGV
jgi:hypothetical protein